MDSDADAVASATPAVGNTESVARQIQNITGGDLFEIVPEKIYPVSHSDCSVIAGEERESDERPALVTHVQNIQQYDTIYVGFPIWWYAEPMAIHTFLEEYDFSGKTIIPFCTSMAVGIEESTKNIRSLCPNSDVKDGLRLRTEQSDVSEELSEWIKSMELDSDINKQTAITLTIGDTVLNAYLNDSVPAKSLIEQLPLTVTLNDSDNDFCGGRLDISYTESDVQSGYKNGDLMFWTPAKNFVIFVDDEELSANTGNLVPLGHITEPQEKLDDLSGTIEVTIALAK